MDIITDTIRSLDANIEYIVEPNNKKHSYYHARKFDCPQRIWVPHYEWKREYIPRSEKTSSTFGKIIVEGHYIEYKVEKGGHWETKYFCK